MFERFAEKARRTVFFARYEASVFGAPCIEIEHLLLGLLREDRTLRSRLPTGAAEQIRKRIEELVPQTAQRISTSADLPLSQDSRRALVCAAEESTALQHRSIECCHLVLGILRIDTSMAAAILREFGIEYAAYRGEVAELGACPPPPPLPPPEGIVGVPLGKAAVELELLLATVNHLEEHGGTRLKRSGWTRKEAMGHLIDWAAAHQQWFARALTEPKLDAGGYPADGWLAAQQYNDVYWRDLVSLCMALNRLILHVIERVPQEKIDTPCRIGVAESIPLHELVRRYVAHYEDIVTQLLMRG